MYAHELRQSDEVFRTKKLDFKSKLLSTFSDKRRHLEYEHQNVNIRHRHNSDNDQYLLNGANNYMNDTHLYDGYNHHSNESMQQQHRPSYNLRRAAANDVTTENPAMSSSATITTATTTTTFKGFSIFSGTNSLLPLGGGSGGIELQRSLSSSDIEQDIKQIHRSLKHIEPINETKSTENQSEDSSAKPSIDVRIEEGRLWYQRAWFSRNSPILLVFDNLEIVPALVLTVGRNDLLVRRSGTNIKHRVSLSLLHDGHLAIRKRGCVL